METPPTRKQSSLDNQESKSAESDKITELTSVTQRATNTFRKKARENTLR